MTSVVILSDFLGLSSRPFQGFTDIQEIQCLGDGLPPESDVVLMLLYEQANNKILAVMNMKKRECSTLEEYTSCDMVDSDPSKSRLRALITDLTVGQSRVYGCNTSVLISGIRMESFSWSITLHHISKWFCFYWNFNFGLLLIGEHCPNFSICIVLLFALSELDRRRPSIASLHNRNEFFSVSMRFSAGCYVDRLLFIRAVNFTNPKIVVSRASCCWFYLYSVTSQAQRFF